nr:phospholipase A2 inhibitor gamma subunit B-like [Caretta caretta]
MPFPIRRVKWNWAELLQKQVEFLQDLPAHTFSEEALVVTTPTAPPLGSSWYFAHGHCLGRGGEPRFVLRRDFSSLQGALCNGVQRCAKVCASREQSCSGPLQLCAPSEGTCITVVAEIRLEGYYFSYTAQSCLEPQNFEPSPFSLTYPHNVTVRMNIVSCDTNGCNARAIPGPYHENEKEKKREKEKEKVLLACTGAEEHCIEDYGVLTLGDIKLMKSAAGCGSPGACMKRLLVKKYAQGLVEMLSRTNCYPAPWASGSIGEP